MPKFLEAKLKKEYPNNPRAVYGTMNALGAMHGNKETAKGEEMQKKHEVDMSKFTGEAHNFDFKRPKKKVVSRYKR